MTVDIYGHLMPGGNKAAVDKLDDETPATVQRLNASPTAIGLDEATA